MNISKSEKLIKNLAWFAFLEILRITNNTFKRRNSDKPKDQMLYIVNLRWKNIIFCNPLISSCIIANFFAISSCFSLANANKDREINDRIKTEEMNVMQNYIQKKKQKMFSQEYDLGIQPKENNLNSYQQKRKNENTSQLSVFEGSEVKVSEWEVISILQRK